MKLTKKAVEGITPGPHRTDYPDDDLKGFGLRVTPAGVKSWNVLYRKAGEGRNGVLRRVTIGRYPDVSPDDARKAAKALLAQVALGNDPASDRRKSKGERVLRDISDDYLEHFRATRKPRTVVEYERIVRKDILPALGGLKLVDIERGDVARMHTKLAKEKPIAANRALAVFSSLWSWAARQGWCRPGDNPATGLEKRKETSRTRWLSDDELARLGEALRQAENEGLPWRGDAGSYRKGVRKPENRRTVLDPMVVSATRFLLLTGMRLREVLGLQWAYVDFQRGLLNLPDSKTGAKIVVLSAPALQVLDGLPQIEASPYCFPGRDGGMRADLKKPWDAVCAAAGLEGVRIHDLRHTNAATGAGAGLSLHLIGGLLGHKQPITTQRYAHLANDPLRQAAEKIGARINEALGDAGRGDGGEVVPMVRR